jgi:hypothetical protein
MCSPDKPIFFLPDANDDDNLAPAAGLPERRVADDFCGFDAYVGDCPDKNSYLLNLTNANLRNLKL